MRSRIKSRDERNLFCRRGGWGVDITVNGERLIVFGFPTKTKARDWRDRAKCFGRDRRYGHPAARPEGPPLRLDDYLDNYLALYARQKRSYARDLISAAHLKKFLGGYHLQDISGEACRRYRFSRAGVKAATINRELALLRSAMRRAVEDGKLAVNPLPAHGLMEKEPAHPPRILKPDEIRRLLAVADSRLAAAILAWVLLGLRHREALKLRREDVDFKAGTLTVISENAKNGKARTIPISAPVAAALKALPGTTFFFENPATGKPLGSLRGPFKKALADSGIGGRCRIHDLRHTFASQALRAGADLRTVAGIIGNSPALCLARYCHTDDETQAAAAARVADLLLLGGRKEVRDEAEEGDITPGESVN